MTSFLQRKVKPFHKHCPDAIRTACSSKFVLDAKIVILSANVIDSHSANIISDDLDNNSFSEDAKIATVRLICLKSDGEKIGNYRPVSVLNCFSKVYERFLHEQFKPFV